MGPLEELFDAFCLPAGRAFSSFEETRVEENGVGHTTIRTNNNGKISEKEFDYQLPKNHTTGYCVTNRLDPRLGSCDSYPPMDYDEYKDGKVIVKYAVAGIDQEKVSIRYEDYRIFVDYVPEVKKDDPELLRKHCHGIKDKEFHVNFALDPRMQDPEDIDWKFDNGCLVITVAGNKNYTKPKNLKKVKETKSV